MAVLAEGDGVDGVCGCASLRIPSLSRASSLIITHLPIVSSLIGELEEEEERG